MTRILASIAALLIACSPVSAMQDMSRSFPSIEVSEMLVPAVDGGKIPKVSWVDKTKPTKAVLVCIHGLGLHSKSYEDFARHMAVRGFPVVAMDVRGFGEWAKEPGHTKIDFKRALSDIQQVLQSVRSSYPGVQVYLVGESMGGAIALRAASMYPELIDGLISSVPANERFQEKITDVKVALHALEGLHHQFKEGKQVIDQATKNPELRKAWITDPLDRIKYSPMDLLQFQLFCNDNHDAAKNVKATPVVVLQGSRDHLIKPSGTIALFNQIASPDKTMIMFGNREHLILEDEQFSADQSAIPVITAWIEQHLNPESDLDKQVDQ